MTQFEFVEGDVLHLRNLLSKGYLDGRNKGMTGDNLLLNFNEGYYGNYYMQWKVMHRVDKRKNTYTLRSMSSDLYLDGRGPRDENKIHLTSSTNRNPAFENFFEWEFEVLPGLGRVALKSISSNRYIDGRAPGYNKPLLADANRFDPSKEKGLQWIITKVDPPIADFGNDTVFLRNIGSGSYLSGPQSIGLVGSNNPFSDSTIHWKLVKTATQKYVVLTHESSEKIVLGPYDLALGAVLNMTERSASGIRDGAKFIVIPYGDKFALRHEESGTFLDGRYRGYTGRDVFLSIADPERDAHKEQVLWDITVVRKQFQGSSAIPK